MRLAPLIAALLALVVAGSASAGKLPVRGYVVYKDLRSHATKEIRDKATGRVVFQTKAGAVHAAADACSDARYKRFDAKWRSFEAYRVNVASTPNEIDPAAALGDLRASHDAWQSPFVTDCAQPSQSSRYDAIYGGRTTRGASLVATLAMDGENTVAFQSLAGTVCDGALACVVIDYDRGRINEADLAFERDLTRYGFQDFWTTDDTTWFDSAGGRFAVSDVATHEFGHFAGLDHVDRSPALTMFPLIHDGAQTLGLGDMRGVFALY